MTLPLRFLDVALAVVVSADFFSPQRKKMLVGQQ